MTEFSQGVTADGPVVLLDGQPMSIDLIVEMLQQFYDASVMWSYPPEFRSLLAKARHMVELMDDAERNHGGLIGGVTLRAKNELRLELSKWK